MKRIESTYYTEARFGKSLRPIIDNDNPYLYSKGRYPTKIKKEELPEHYIPVRSRVFEYTDGFIKMTGIVDMDYTYSRNNHLFKDDYLYISYSGSLSYKKLSWCDEYDIEDYDICVCGNDIINLVLAAEKYSNYDTSKIRRKIEEKRIWLRDNEPEYYSSYVGEDKDIFKVWEENGLINPRFCKGTADNGQRVNYSDL